MLEDLDVAYLPSVVVAAEMARSEAELRDRGATVGERFGFPDGDAVEIDLPGPQRIAVYVRTRPERAASIVGRRDF